MTTIADYFSDDPNQYERTWPLLWIYLVIFQARRASNSPAKKASSASSEEDGNDDGKLN